MKTFNKKTFRQLVLSIFILLIPNLQAEESKDGIEPFSEAELEQILAPIALYPDTILSHILVAATYPLEVIQAERWTKQNPDVPASDAVEAVENEEWDPSVKALVAFPKVLERLSENLNWTQKLGDAFLQNEEKLIASVQSLRQKAYDSGNLDKMDKVSVKHEQETIIIEPVEREVVYVPYYDTRVVYGPWYWSHYPPVYWGRPYYANHHYASHASPFYWGPRVHLSFGFFFSSFLWNDHHVVRIPRHYYRPHHYYGRRDIVRHREAVRWTHNPVHRRGVSYRSVTVRNRYRSPDVSVRASRDEVRAYRDNGRYAINNKDPKKRLNRVITTDGRKRQGYKNSSHTQIASPNRIKQELRDGRISIKERNTRPVNNLGNRSKERSDKKVNHQLIKERQDVVRNNPPKRTSTKSRETVKQPKYDYRPSKHQEKNTKRSSNSESRSKGHSSKRSSGSSRSSSSNRQSHSDGGKRKKR